LLNFLPKKDSLGRKDLQSHSEKNFSQTILAKIFHYISVRSQAQRVFPQLSMLCPALLMAWLATMPQFLFMPKATVDLLRVGPHHCRASRLLALGGMQHAQPRPCSAWSMPCPGPWLRAGAAWQETQKFSEHPAGGGGRKIACTSITACTHASTHVHTAYMHSLHTACTHASTHVHTAYMHSSHTACTHASTHVHTAYMHSSHTACTHASTHVHTAYMHSLHTACTHASTHVHTAYMHSSHTACTELMCTWLAQGWLPACPASSTKLSDMLSPLAAACTCSALSAAFLLPLCVRCCTGTCCCTFDCEERGGNPSPLFCFAIFIANIITMKEVRLNPKFVIWGC